MKEGEPASAEAEEGLAEGSPEGEAAGLNFWNDALGGGAVRRAEVLAQVSESDENILGIAASIEDGILI